MAKHGKNPSVSQKQYIKEELGLDPAAWLVVKWNPPEVELQNRETGKNERFSA